MANIIKKGSARKNHQILLRNDASFLKDIRTDLSDLTASDTDALKKSVLLGKTSLELNEFL